MVESKNKGLKNRNWSLLKYFLIRRNTWYFLILNIFLVSIFNLFSFIDLNNNKQLYYEFKDHVNCYIEPYLVLKLAYIFKYSFIVNFSLITIWCIFLSLKEFENEKLLPITFFENSKINFLILLVYQVIVGITLLIMIFLETNKMLTKSEWFYLPFNEAQFYKILLIDFLIFNFISSLTILIINNCSVIYKYVLFLLVLIVFTFSKSVLPGEKIIKKLSSICPPKKI